MEYKIYSRLSSLVKEVAAMLLMAATALSVASCRGEIDGVELPEEDFNVRIAIAGQGSRSMRAGDTPDYATGTAEENYIDISDLYVLTFSIPEGKTNLDDESKLLEIMWDPRGAAAHNNTVISFDGSTVWLKGKLDETISAYRRDFCVVAVANAKSFQHNPEAGDFTPEIGISFKDLREAGIFDFKGSGAWSWMPENETVSSPEEGEEPVVTAGKGIPMFGVKRVNLDGYMPTFHSEKNPYALVSNGSSTVWLVRALAKVMIELSDNLKDYRPGGVPTDVEIASASIGNAYNEWFQLIPSLSRMQDFTSKGETGQMVAIPGDEFVLKRAEEGNSLDFIVDGSKEFATVYIPEYPLLPEAPKFSLKMKIGDEVKEYEFDFKEYQTDPSASGVKPLWQYAFRNHIYIFTVNLSSEHHLQLKVRMAKWDYHKIIFDM